MGYMTTYTTIWKCLPNQGMFKIWLTPCVIDVETSAILRVRQILTDYTDYLQKQNWEHWHYIQSSINAKRGYDICTLISIYHQWSLTVVFYNSRRTLTTQHDARFSIACRKYMLCNLYVGIWTDSQVTNISKDKSLNYIRWNKKR